MQNVQIRVGPSQWASFSTQVESLQHQNQRKIIKMPNQFCGATKYFMNRKLHRLLSNEILQMHLCNSSTWVESLQLGRFRCGLDQTYASLFFLFFYFSLFLLKQRYCKIRQNHRKIKKMPNQFCGTTKYFMNRKLRILLSNKILQMYLCNS